MVSQLKSQIANHSTIPSLEVEQECLASIDLAYIAFHNFKGYIDTCLKQQRSCL